MRVDNFMSKQERQSLRSNIFERVGLMQVGGTIKLRDHSERTMALAAAVQLRKDQPDFLLRTYKAGKKFEVERVR